MIFKFKLTFLYYPDGMTFDKNLLKTNYDKAL